MRLFPWDWAAAGVIIREAGGVVGTIAGEYLRHDRPVLLLAANSDKELDLVVLPEFFSTGICDEMYT